MSITKAGIVASIAWAMALLASPSVAWAAPETYGFDKEHTEVRFSWDHLGLSRQSGRFHGVTGTVVFDQERPEASSIDVKPPKEAPTSTGCGGSVPSTSRTSPAKLTTR